MLHVVRVFVASLVWLTAGVVWAHAQQPVEDDRPVPAKPAPRLTRQELDQREAKKLYGLAMLHQRHDRLLEAVRTFEQALKLDPESAAIHKALVPLYLALGRHNDAFEACRKAVDFDPGDHEMWYVYARQFKERNRPKEAITALARALACTSLKDFPDLILQMNFELGALHEEARDYAAAEEAFSKVVAILDKPDALLQAGPFSRAQLYMESARTHERIGQLCLKARRYEQAIEAFRKAQAILSDEAKGKDTVRAAQLNRNLAEVCLAQKRPDEALEYLDKYIKLQPAGADAYELRIKVLKETDREQEILPSLREFAARDERNIALQLLLARESGQRGQTEQAERLYLKLAGEEPSPEVYRGLFRLYAREMRTPEKVLELLDQTMQAANSKRDEASAAARRARAMLAVLRGDSELVKALLSVAEQHLRGKRGRERGEDWQVPTFQLLAVLAVRTRQLDLADALYRRCLPYIKQHPEAEAEVYGGLLIVLAQARKYEAVIEVCREGLRESKLTKHVLFHRRLAEALFELGRSEEALREAERAVTLSDDRERLDHRRYYAHLLSELGQTDKAIAECQKMLKEHSLPGDIRRIRIVLSDVYSNSREFAKAVAQLRLVLEVDPNDDLACNNLGYLLADQRKELEEAERLIRKAIELDRDARKDARKKAAEGDIEEDNAAYLDSLGWVLFRRGQFKEAREWLEKAAALAAGVDDPTVWDHLGDVCFRLNEPARARAAWEKSLSLYETTRRRHSDERNKELKHKLQLLDKDSQP